MKELAEKISNCTPEQVEEIDQWLHENSTLRLVPNGLVSALVGGGCPTGEHWDNVLKKCVLDAGIR